MRDKLSFNKIALTLAALGATGVVVGGANASSLIVAKDVPSALELDDDEKKKKKDDDKKKKKKGGEGSCGEGSCG